jgi:hypothetical protein
VGEGGVQLGPLGTAATNRPIMPAPGDYDDGENLVEWWLAGETEVLGEYLPQCHFIHHKSQMSWPGANPGRRGGKPATNRLSYGTGFNAYCFILCLYRSDYTIGLNIL